METLFADATTDTTKGFLELIDVLQGKKDFHKHYYVVVGGLPKDIGEQIAVPFSQVEQLAENLIQGNAFLTEDNLAFQFIHRFDAGKNQWFLCLQACEIQQSAAGGCPAGFTRYDVTQHKNLRFDLNINGNIDFGGSTLPQSVDYDNAYTTHVKYDATGAQTGSSHTSIVKGVHVSAITIPWKKELLQLAIDNGCAAEPTAILMIECRCYKETDIQMASVEWPHSLSLYMSKTGTGILLGVHNAAQGQFHNRGADIGGMCPPNCSKYCMPTNLKMVEVPIDASLKLLSTEAIFEKANTDFAHTLSMQVRNAGNFN